MSKIVYIAGPMRGYPESNFPMFYLAEEFLKKCGYRVVNPARMKENDNVVHELLTDKDHDYKLGLNLVMLIQNKTEMLVLLPGWEYSKGAGVELVVAAYVLGAEVMELKFTSDKRPFMTVLDNTRLPIISCKK